MSEKTERRNNGKSVQCAACWQTYEHIVFIEVAAGSNISFSVIISTKSQ